MLLKEYRNLELTDMPEPDVGDDDVLVRVRACGICGSDIHGFDGSSGRRIPPLVMGHEAAGVVERIGANVDSFTEGDRVTFDSTVSCGKCGFCKSGRINLCDNRTVLGVSCGDYRRHGAFAEFVVVPKHIVYELSDDLPFEHAAMIEAVSIAVHAVERAKVSTGDSALVVGAGMIGLLVIQALRAAGCDHIVAVDMQDNRLELAKRVGAAEAINATTDVVQAVREQTKGKGVDVAIEAVGATAPVTTAIDSTRKGGTVVLVGNLAPNVEVPLQSIVTRELDVLGSCASNGEYPRCIELMASGAINVGPIISAVAPLDQGPSWFDRLYANEPGLMKVILTP